MSQTLNAPISSTNAIKSTIETDALTFRWFLYLVSQKKAQNDLTDGSEVIIYGQLKRNLLFQGLCSIALAATLLYAILTKQFIVFCAAAVVVPIYFIFRRTARVHVAHLSLKLIAKHFKSDGAEHYTLYRLGERLSKHYQIKSLVMSMTSVDDIVRKAVLYALIFASFILPLKFLQFWGFAFTAYWVTCTIINTAIVYKRLPQ